MNSPTIQPARRATPARIPNLLAHYLHHEEFSLNLVTEIIGTSSSWLILCFLANTLGRPNTSVIFVSWMQYYDFWRKEARRVCALDIGDHTENGRLIYVDGLGLSHNKFDTESSSKTLGLVAISTAIAEAISTIDEASDILLILDSPDILMGLGSIDQSRILNSILKWRHQVHSMVISLTTDSVVDMDPRNSSLSTLLGDQQQLLLALAHQADNIFSTKLLDSGTAKDVSGVVRIHPRTNAEDMKEKELLYFVDSGSNKGVEVWERGGLRN